MSTTISTNNHRLPLLSWDELKPRQREEFDYAKDSCDDWSPRFVFAYGSWWDTQEFERVYRRSQESPPFSFGVDDDSPLLKWDGIQATSHGTAVVIRYIVGDYGDYDNVVVGFVTIT